MEKEEIFSEEISKRFDHHAPSETKILKHQVARTATKRTAQDFYDWLPEGREKALALTKLEEALFWANAAIARN